MSTVNKMRRQAMYHRALKVKKKDQKKARLKRKREIEQLGDEAPPKQKPRTLESTREYDETVVEDEDPEVQMDEATDEMSGYFEGVPPRILLTTSRKPSRVTYKLMREFLTVFPGTVFYRRKQFTVGEICAFASNRDFTDVLVFEEDRPRKEITGLTVCHLPDGPTARFRVTNVVRTQEIKGHGVPTKTVPEIILNNFSTKLGRTVARMLACLGPQKPEFKGRTVLTFHNQRDFIFFRRHRYIFETRQKARLQEIGPRFTLRLESLQRGLFDPVNAEYLWKHKKEMDTSRRRFFL